MKAIWACIEYSSFLLHISIVAACGALVLTIELTFMF